MEKYVAWCCDYETKTGEGQLAKKFLKEKIKINKIKVLKPKFKFYCSDYIYPFIGVIIVWYYFLSGCKIIYVNFLPLWNPLIFLLCPPKTTFGPITGSIQINNSIKLN